MRTLAIWVLMLIALAGCSSKTQVTSTPSPSTASTSPANCKDRALPTPTPEATAPTTKPGVSIPDGPPPCALVSVDVHQGTGPAVTPLDTVTVQYVGLAWSTHMQFDSSWDRGQPATFPLANVIKGWQQGIPGMKAGGRRELIVPPDLAYGARPPTGSGIGSNETLVFVVDLIKIG